MEGEGMEDYGDYVTRCICEFKHDDGYMIACDGCSVWQHVECMQVDPNNLPDKYLCEICSPRPVDRRRARQIQIRKREDLSDAEDEDRVSTSQDDTQKTSSLPHILLSSLSNNSKKKKRGKVVEPPRLDVKRPKREKVEMRKLRRKPLPKPLHATQPTTRTSSIQSLLNAASLLEEQQLSQDIWSTNASPWTDKYDTAEHNRYSEPVRVFVSSHLSQLKSEAVVHSHEEYSTIEGRSHPVCSLSEVQRKRKGVVADMGIGEDELVIEYKGKITVKQAVLSDLAPGGKSLWKYRPCPFVYLYDKVPDLDLCIDARNYGNLARFIRRSCSPNAELRHFFVSNELHFGVYALMAISPGEEVTLPFDFRYDKCEYTVECACGQSGSCLVSRSSLTSGIKKQMTKPLAEEEQLSSRSRSGSRTLLHAAAQDEDSNSSWASTSSSKKRAKQSRILSPARQHSRQASREVSSDSDEDGDAPEKRITKSREERKTEAVWRMFEKMEASAQRKRHQLMSEGDSDTLSSPSTLHPSPLLSHKQLKERRSSTSSKKFQMMPGGKMRLSSVSSTDEFPQAELSESILSPPMTPGFGGAPDLPYASPRPLSLTSPPPPSTPRPDFEVTPFLHPKYLFAEFPLPWKKAILRQWEREQNDSCYTNGHSLPVYSARGGEPMRPRVRGSLKHRWLKQHSEQLKSTGSDKENEVEEPLRTAPLSYKKRILLRWEESGSTDHEPPPASDEAPPPTTSIPQATQDQRKSPALPTSAETQVEAKDDGNGGGNVFDYFDDFSDGEEFELVGREKPGSDEQRPESEKTREGPHTPPGEEEEEEDRSVPHPPRLRKQNSSLSIISDTSLQSSDGEMEEKEEEGKEKEGDPPPTLLLQALSTPATSVSDILSDLGQSGTREDALLKQERSDVEVESSSPAKPSHEFVTPPAGKELGELKPEAPSSSPLPLEPRLLELVPKEKEEKEQLGEAREEEGKEKEGGARVDEEPNEGTVGEGPVELLEPPRPLASHEETTGSPDKTSGLPKTPGKRKINLSEYRNRARKPAERRSSAEKASPPHASVSATPLFPTFLSAPPPPLLSSSYSSSLMLGTMGTLPSSGPTTVPGGVSAPSVPQFEPVSPDDEDQTPPLINMEDSSMMHSDKRPLPAMMVPAIPSYPPQGLVAVEQPLGQMPSFPQQPPTAQYVLDSRWNRPPMEQTQDPRRGAISVGEMYSQPVLHGHTGDMPPGPQLMGGGDMQVLPPPMVQQQAGGYPPSHPPPPHPSIIHQGMLPQPHGELHPPGMMHHPGPDYCPRQPGPPHPHAFVPRHQPRGGFRPHRPGGNYY